MGLEPEGAADKGGRILTVGAGHAGGTAAALLRQHGWTGPIVLPVSPDRLADISLSMTEVAA